MWRLFPTQPNTQLIAKNTFLSQAVIFARKKVEEIYKPGSVLTEMSDDHSSRMHVAIHLKQPTRTVMRKTPAPRGVQFLFGFASDGVYQAIYIAIYAVRSYRTFSPFPLTEIRGSLNFFSTIRSGL